MGEDFKDRVINRILKEYVKDRDEAIIEAVLCSNLDKFKAFANKWQERGLIHECFTMVDDSLLEISIRKMCIHCVNIPAPVKDTAAYWLLSRGYDLELE